MRNSISDTLQAIRIKLCKKGYSYSDTERIVAPLVWYIDTGRAPTDFIKRIIVTNELEKTTIAKRLAKTYYVYDDAINSICSYLNIDRA